MRHVVAHELGLELACQAARAACADYASRFARFEPKVVWSDPQRGEVRFQARGVQLVGRFEVRADRMILDLDVPLLLRPLQGRAVQVIDRELRRWIERARAGELPPAAQPSS